MEVLASEWLKRKMFKFWLPSVVQECLCLSIDAQFFGLYGVRKRKKDKREKKQEKNKEKKC